MGKEAPIDEATLRGICDVLGDTNDGLTGSEIGALLLECSMDDPYPEISTKRHRLFEALRRRQARDGCSNGVLGLIKKAMNPVRFVDAPDYFESQRSGLNRRLAFIGLELRDDGRLARVQAARTVPEAEQRASQLRSTLLARKVHPDVLMFCRAELVQDNYFHAVFEAAKSVAQKIRDRTGLDADGAKLVDQALGLGANGIPRLAFNTLQTETERSEHTGLMNLLKGLFGAFRNTLAHVPKITWKIEEQDALDILSLCSLLHRRLDEAVSTGGG